MQTREHWEHVYSTLADGLLAAGWSALTVLDISAAALAAARRCLGPRAGAVTWIEADITAAALSAGACTASGPAAT